jgi:hypothetical protein
MEARIIAIKAARVTRSDSNKSIGIFYKQKTSSSFAGRGPRISLIAPRRVGAGIGTRPERVAGLHRAVPSTSLDKVYTVVGRMLAWRQ